MLHIDASFDFLFLFRASGFHRAIWPCYRWSVHSAERSGLLRICINRCGSLRIPLAFLDAAIAEVHYTFVAMSVIRERKDGHRTDDRIVHVDPERIRRARNYKGWTQEQLAEEMDNRGFKSGFAVRTLQELERTGRCRAKTLWALMQVLGLSEGELLAPWQHPWTIPSRQHDPERDPAGALLMAEFAIVPFHFRTEERDSLKHWCNENRRFGIRLYAGKGGIGKTRLAIELCHNMAKEQWRAGFIDYLMFRPDEREWDRILRDPSNLLLVFDYAENHLGELEWVLRRMDRYRTAHVRVLLLARSAEEWWKRLKAVKEVGDLIGGPATSVQDLRPLSLSLQDRQKSFRIAAEAFAKQLAKRVPAVPKEGLLEPYFDRVLLLHMNAMAAVDGVKVEGENGILDYVLQREERYWINHIRTRKLADTLLEGIGQAMSAATFVHGLETREDGFELLRVLPFFASQTPDVLNAVNLLLHDCYAGDRWIEPVQPDELGRRLYERTFQDEQLRNAVFRAVADAAKQKSNA